MSDENHDEQLPGRDGNREYEESRGTMKGVIIALVLGVTSWLIIGGIAFAVVNSLR